MYVYWVLKAWCPEGTISVTWQLAINVAWEVWYCSPLAYAMDVLELSKAVPGESLPVAGVLAGVCRTLAGQINLGARDNG